MLHAPLSVAQLKIEDVALNFAKPDPPTQGAHLRGSTQVCDLVPFPARFPHHSYPDCYKDELAG
jgi:hypothetical protein